MLITNIETNIINKELLVNTAKSIIRLHKRQYLDCNEVEIITSLDSIKQTNTEEVTITHDTKIRKVFNKSIALTTNGIINTKIFIEFDLTNRYEFNLIIYKLPE